MRIVFFGTPETAVPFLEEAVRGHEVAAVVSQPDKPAGRGLSVAPTPVKKRALELGLKVLQPARPSDAASELAALNCDLAVVVAYGRILKPDILSAARLGAINVHFSLLPKYRGAAPVQWALVHGESRTGVTIFWLDEGMDTGPVQLVRETQVGPEEDAGALLARLTRIGTEGLGEALSDIAAGRVLRTPQSGSPSLAPLIQKEDGRLSFQQAAARIHDRVRGLSLWPKTWLELSGAPPRRLGIVKTALGEGVSSFPPGTIISVDRSRGILVQCSDGSRLWVVLVQPEGKKPVPAADFLNGLRLAPGDPFPAA